MEAHSREKDGLRQVWPKDADAYRNQLDQLASRANIKFQKSSSFILASADFLALFSALLLGRFLYWMYFEEQAPDSFMVDFGPVWALQAWLFQALVLITLVWFWSAGHYSKRRPFWDELRETLKILLFIGALNAALVFLAKWPVSRMWLGMTWALSLALVPTFRSAAKHALLAAGGWRRPTVIVGTGENAIRVAEALGSERLMGYDVLAFIAGPSHMANTSSSIHIKGTDLPIYYYSSRLWELLRNMYSPHLVVALEHNEQQELRDLLSDIGEGYRNLHISPPVTGLPLYGTEVDRFFRHEVLLLNVRNNLVRLWAQAAKRIFDLVAASILLVSLVPLFVLIALGIKLEDRGSVLYTQERVGRKGRPFKVIKFRSMALNAHEVLLQWLDECPETRKEYEENNFKLRVDPRVTRVGRWLRRCSMDELPQLWNVIRGEMSLVGPRPLLAREVADYGQAINLYKQARPGITGIWQISGRSRTRFSDRANLDAWYIRNWSLWYDLYILLRTVVVVLKKDGAY